MSTNPPINYAAAAKRQSLPSSTNNSTVPTPLASPALNQPATIPTTNGKLNQSAPTATALKEATNQPAKSNNEATAKPAAPKLDFNKFFQASPESPTSVISTPVEPVNPQPQTSNALPSQTSHGQEGSAPVRRPASTYDPGMALPAMSSATPSLPGAVMQQQQHPHLTGNARAFTPNVYSPDQFSGKSPGPPGQPFLPGQFQGHPNQRQPYQNTNRNSMSGPSPQPGGQRYNQNNAVSPRISNGPLPHQNQQGVPQFTGYQNFTPQQQQWAQQGFSNAPYGQPFDYYAHFQGQPMQMSPHMQGQPQQGGAKLPFTPGAPPSAASLARMPSTGAAPVIRKSPSPNISHLQQPNVASQPHIMKASTPQQMPTSLPSTGTPSLTASPASSSAALPGIPSLMRPASGASLQPGSPFKPAHFNPAATEFSPSPAIFTPAPRKSAAIQIRKPPSTPASPAAKAPSASTTTDVEQQAQAKKAADEKAAKEKEDQEKAQKAEAEKLEQAKAAREAEEKRLAEEKRIAEEKEAQRVAEEKRVAEEAQANEKADEEERIAREKAEADRLAEEAEKGRLEDEANKATDETTLKPANPVVEQLRAQSPSNVSVSETSSRPSSTEPPASNDSKDDRPKPASLDLSRPALSRQASTSGTPISASIKSAKPIDDLSSIDYPTSIQSPKVELNVKAQPGKYRYDRDFLLQFEKICVQRPEKLPSLELIGMVDINGSSFTPAGGKGGRRPSGPGPSLGGRSSSMLGSPRMAHPAMGSFTAVSKSSTERFNASTANLQQYGVPSKPGMSGRQPSMGQMGMQGRRSQTGRKRNADNRPSNAPSAADLNAFAQLQGTENAWTSSVQSGPSKKQNEDPNSPENVQRKVKALLNKLTLEKFDSISDQVLAWANKSASEKDGRILRQVIALIFEKATDEAAWSEMYARLCRKLLDLVSPKVTDETLASSSVDKTPPSGGLLFRKYLLNRCQEDYERGWSDRARADKAAAEKAADDQAKKDANEKAAAEAATKKEGEVESKETEILSDEYYAAQKIKRRGLGLVRFIGELFKLGMLTSRIMHDCIVKLLGNVDNPEEDDVESLCRLLTTVGMQLDEDPKNDHKSRQMMHIYFDRLQKISVAEKVPSRIKFMVLDVIDLRAAKWKGNKQASGPKTIAQVHQDAAKQQEADSRRIASSGGRLPKIQDQLSRPNSRRGQGREGPDGWSVAGPQQVPTGPTKVGSAGNLASFGKMRSQSGQDRGFGPSTTTFNRKTTAQSSEREVGQAPANMFAALAGEGGAEAISEEPHGDSAQSADEEDADEAPAELDQATIDRMIKTLVAEFLQLKKVDEGVEGFKELPETSRTKLIEAFVAKAMDQKEAEVKLIALLFTAVHEQSLATPEDFKGALRPTIETLEDLEADVPKAFVLMGHLLRGSGLTEADVKELGQSMEAEVVEEAQERLLSEFTHV